MLTTHSFITDERYNPELHSINNLVGKTVLNVYCGVTIEDVRKWVENKKGRMVHRVVEKRIEFEPHLGLFFYLSDGTFASLISHVVDNYGQMHDSEYCYDAYSSIEGGEILLNEEILSVEVVANYTTYKSKGTFAYWNVGEEIEIDTSKGKCVIEYHAGSGNFSISPEYSESSEEEDEEDEKERIKKIEKENKIYVTMNHVEFFPNDFEGHWSDKVHEIK